MTSDPRAAQATDLIRLAPPSTLATTDFVLHTVGIILTATQQAEAYRRVLYDLVRRQVWTLHAAPSELFTLQRMQDFNLTFDDAFQYMVAERESLTNVSFDSDFDRTPRGRQ